MPALKINNMLPQGEQPRLYVDGVPVDADILSVPSSFHLRIEQVRASVSSSGLRRHFAALTRVISFGGKYAAGEELASPYRAVWDGECELDGDGEITIWLNSLGTDIQFEVEGQNVAFPHISSQTVTNRKEIMRWIVSVLPFLLPLSVVLLLLPFLILTTTSSNSDTLLYAVKGVFVVLPVSALIFIWVSLFRRLFPAKKEAADSSAVCRKQIKFLTVLQTVTLILFSAAAVCQFLGLFVFDLPVFHLTVFFATAVLIVHMVITMNMTDSLSRKGMASKGIQRQMEKLGKLQRAVWAVYACIFLMTFISATRPHSP